ncbi:MAG: ABC transporter substrate-binding protein [Firmicutes bacterium]|nr:ABC transporter substrate-binding protein [Bacillota bacterium]
MKKFAKIITITMAIIMAFSMFTVFAGSACINDDDDEEPEIIRRTVTFLNYDGEVFTTVTVNNNTTVTQPAVNPTRDEYAFSYWRLYGTTTQFSFDTAITADTTLVAHFIPESNAITITFFESIGGRIISQTSIERGDTILEPSDPELSGHNFLGWYTLVGSTRGDRFVFGQPSVDDVNIVAHWELDVPDASGALRMDSFNFDMVFHPFFATSMADGAVAGQTQVSLITANRDGDPVAGDDLPTVARDFRQRVFVRGVEDPNLVLFNALTPQERRDENIVQTHYEFLIKNGIRFSDGTPLTIQDVLFNMYVYLDAVYTGSNTMNSTAILGLNQWRTQDPYMAGGHAAYIAWRRQFENLALIRRNDLENFWHPTPISRRNFRLGTASQGTARERRIIDDAHDIRAGFWQDLANNWTQAAATNFHPVHGQFADEQWFQNSNRNQPHFGFTEPWQVFLNWFNMISIHRGGDGQIDWLGHPVTTLSPDGPFNFGPTRNFIGSMPTLENSGQYLYRYQIINGRPEPIFAARHQVTGDPILPVPATPGTFEATRVYTTTTDEVTGASITTLTAVRTNEGVDLAIPVIRSGLYTITHVYNAWLGLLDSEEIGRTTRFPETAATPNLAGRYDAPTTDWHVNPETLEIDFDAGFNGNRLRLYGLTDAANPQITPASRINTSRYLMARMIDDTNLTGTQISNEMGFSYGTVRARIFSIAASWGVGGRLLQDWTSEEITNRIEEQAGDAINRPVPTIEGITVTETRDFTGRMSGHRDLGQYHHVLNVRIGGIDPAAIWRVTPTVAPMHYYSNPTAPGRSQFHDPMTGYRGFNMPGVSFNNVPVDNTARPWISSYNPNIPSSPGFIPGNRAFFSQVFQATEVQRLPMGAGAFMATNRQSERNRSNVDTTVTHDQFFENNVVRFIYNDYFHTTGEFMHNPLTRYLSYHVMPPHQVISALAAGTINFGGPSATQSNINVINDTPNVEYALVRNRGYGYVGINASRVRCIYARRAIMYAMNPNLTIEYFGRDLSEIINRPMSRESWAYPEGATPWYEWRNEAQVIQDVRNLLNNAGFAGGSDGVLTRNCPDRGEIRLSFTFTIAGAEQDHPAWDMFIQAARILNRISVNGGNFDIQVTTNPAALAAISAGTLDVWAAAWGSGVDPDMFQLYHPDSTAVNVNAWGYPWLIGQGNATPEEARILNQMGRFIDYSRSTFDREERIIAFHTALDYLMELAIEFPTYQRRNLPAFNISQIDVSSLNPNPTPFHGPISHIWTLVTTN